MKIGNNKINHILTRRGLVNYYKIRFCKDKYIYIDYERSSFNTRVFS